MMRAILVKEPGGVEQLYLGEYPIPEPKPDELLVRVKATALNRADILQRRGHYPPPPGASPILGLEMAGIVEKAGTQCTQFREGDRVFGLLPGGGYAEYAVIPESLAMPIPEHMDFTEAAAIAEVFLTAYQAMFWLAELKAGQYVLIHAGASGVGTAAIQLAKEAGFIPIVTAGTEEKLAFCRELGAVAAFNYKEGPFAPKVMEATDRAGVHAVLDFVGAPYWHQNVECLTTDGRLILISALGGVKVAEVNLAPLLAKRIHVIATTLRARSVAYKAQLVRDFTQFAWKRFADGRLRPIIDRVWPWTQVREAHRYMEENRNIGKIVLRVE
jgi:tumor protein p53-inducible protein 3